MGAWALASSSNPFPPASHLTPPTTRLTSSDTDSVVLIDTGRLKSYGLCRGTGPRRMDRRESFALRLHRLCGRSCRYSLTTQAFTTEFSYARVLSVRSYTAHLRYFQPREQCRAKQRAALRFLGGRRLDWALTPNVFLRGEFEFIQFAPFANINVPIVNGRVGAGFKF